MCSIEVFRLLDEPLTKNVRDLRSAVVKEVCQTLSHMAVELGDGLRPLAYMILPAMIDVTASGNKVIATYVHDAITVILSHCRAKNAITIVLEHSRSKYRPLLMRCAFAFFHGCACAVV